ncbi:hypothetical protein SDC9_158978 [bioreactor metagenome]|uniref:Uncharacterized protein n=1 Tax=bioreactor metagenome TaxID=1076179 RepID=A0A645FBI6_9ZZZZ
MTCPPARRWSRRPQSCTSWAATWRQCPKSPTTRPMPVPRRRSTSMAWCANTICVPAATSATCRSIWWTRPRARTRAMPSQPACGPNCRRSVSASTPTSRWSKCRRARRCSLPSWRRSMARMRPVGIRSPRPCAPCSSARLAWWTWTTAASLRHRRRCCWWTGRRPPCSACRSRPSSPRCAPDWPARPRPFCMTRPSTRRPRCCNCRPSSTAT